MFKRLLRQIEDEIKNSLYALLVLVADIAFDAVVWCAKKLFPDHQAHYALIEEILGWVAVGSIVVGLVCPLILAFLNLVALMIEKILALKRRLFP